MTSVQLTFTERSTILLHPFLFRSCRMPDPRHQQCEPKDNTSELVHDTIPEDDISPHHSRPAIHWRPDLEGDTHVKEQINTDTEQFDALFARSNASPPPSPHPRCYSSTSPSARPSQILTEIPLHLYAKSQPHLIFSSSSSSSSSAKAFNDRRRSLAAGSPSLSVKSQSSNPSLLSSSAQMKRKNFSVPHTGQAFLQSTTSPSEQLEPLARSCSYKRPQSIKKYRQQKKGKEREKEQKEYSASSATSSRKYSTQNNNVSRTVTSESARKSISSATSRISATDLMANDDQWSSPKANRSARIGKISFTDHGHPR